MRKDILEKKLVQIHEVLKTKHEKENHLGVLAGLSGIALFQFYYSKYLDTETNADIGVDIISNCIEKVNTGYSYSTFCNGIAGLGWVLDHLEQENFIEINADDLLSNIDDFLFQTMVKDFNKKDYDYLHGGLGYALYFLQRFKSTNSKTLKEKYEAILFKVINFIEILSEEEGNKIKWISVINTKTGEKGCNLSLSHGMSSIIGILTKLHEQEPFKKQTETLLKGAVNYILSLKTKNDNNLSLFPNTISEKASTINYNSRVAWCYGDLGIALKLWFAAKTLNNKALKATAISIFKHAAFRVKQEDTKVIDAGICHGSYGNAQIFYRMYKETSVKEFNDAANFWIEDGLNKAIYKDGYAGYKQYTGINNNWQNLTSIIDGVAGIGLVIIDQLANFETNWDECLMIS